MYRLRIQVVVCAVIALLAGGCLGATPRHDFPFDESGWGGDNPDYTIDVTGDIVLRGQLLVNRDFRWANNRFSFEFKDSANLIWRLLLFDERFRGERRRKLLGKKSLLRVAGGKPMLGVQVPPDRYWTLWSYDIVLAAEFLRDTTGPGYKVFATRWTVQVDDADLSRRAETVANQGVQLIRGGWNKLEVQIQDGNLTYTLNGRKGSGAFQMDSRLRGRLGFSVARGSVLHIRKLKLGRGSP